MSPTDRAKQKGKSTRLFAGASALDYVHASKRSEALAVHDGGPGLVVLALGDPHLLEGAQRRQDGVTDPYGVLPLRRRHGLDLHRRRRQRRELLHPALADAGEHRSAASEHGVRVPVLADVHVTLHDALEVPVRHDAMLGRVLQRQHAALALRLVPDIAVLLVHAHHDAGHLRAADDGGEDGAGRIVAGEAALHHAAAVVADDGGNLCVAHGCDRRGTLQQWADQDTRTESARAP
mmetsp:Transcript_73594/g.213010  ORF Transcript_73594/g.213010 Transcript_73594/m.213010 type:complete len:235 (-) Transcript_73594:80-784(-)